MISKFGFWQRESSRDYKDKKRPNIIIWDRFLSFNPGALAQPKIQILRPLRYISIIFCCLLTSCTQENNDQKTWQSFQARNEKHSLDRPYVYHAHVPFDWKRKDHPQDTSVVDTRLPIAEFFIGDETEYIRITIHTFPTSSLSSSIPPQMQVGRWKNQFDSLDPSALSTRTESRGGFQGLFFEAEGTTQNKYCSILAWSMQLSSFYLKKLQQGKNPLDQYKQADYTIKAIGSKDLLQQHKEAIIEFAHSFELIEEFT